MGAVTTTARHVGVLRVGRQNARRTTRCSCTSLPGRQRGRRWSLHTHQSYPVGHLSTMYWSACSLATSTGTSARPAGPSTPGAAFSRRGMPRRRFRLQLRAIPGEGRARSAGPHRVTTLCAPPTVWRMLVQEPLADNACRCAKLLSAGEPLESGGHRAGADGLEHDASGTVRPDGNDSADRESPGQPSSLARWAGR